MDERLSSCCGCDKQPSPYCIRCGKPLHDEEIYYSPDDPDHQEELCFQCYNRLKGDRKGETYYVS